MQLKKVILLVIAFIVTHICSQPMDWSHYFAYNNNDAVSSFLIDDYGNLLCLGEFAEHGSPLYLTADDLNSCMNHFRTTDRKFFNYCLNKKNGDVLTYKKDTIFVYRNGNFRNISFRYLHS